MFQAPNTDRSASPRAFADVTLEAVKRQLVRLQNAEQRMVVPEQAALYRPVAGMHFHNRYELVFQLSGETLWQCVRTTVRVPTDSLLLLPLGVAHKEYADPDAGQSVNINMSVGQYELNYHGCCIPKLDTKRFFLSAAMNEHGGQCVRWLDEICRLKHDGYALSSPIVLGLLMSVTGVILETLQASKIPTRSRSHLVVRCRHRILNRLSDPNLSVPALASYVGCAPDYLSHIFHLETGETISACIKRERLAVGRHLLETTGMNINEVALSSGFADSNYFSRQFRQAFGFSPRTYRKELC